MILVHNVLWMEALEWAVLKDTTCTWAQRSMDICDLGEFYRKTPCDYFYGRVLYHARDVNVFSLFSTIKMPLF